MKKFKKEAYIEEYEKNLAIMGVFVFIIFGVVFMTFLLPSLYKIKNNSVSSNNNGNGVAYNTKKEADNYKSGLVYSKNNNFSEALNYFEKAVEAEPTNIDYLTELAVTHYMLKNYDESTKVYKKIISLEKENVFAYNSIGNNYSIIKDYNNAEVYYRKAFEINPYSIASYNNLALMYSDQDKNDKAIEVLKQGLESNPDSTELKITLRILEK